MPATIDQRALEAAITVLMEANKAGAYQKAGDAASTPSLPYLHGPGGIFGVAGLDRDVFSTHVSPRGLLSALPAFGSIDDRPLFAYLTGFGAETGAEKDGVCDDPPTAGAIKGCLQTAQFGRYEEQTRTIEVNHVGLRINRGEMGDLRMVNQPIGGTSFMPSGTTGIDLSMALNAEMEARMVEVGVAFERKLTRHVWTGNPASNSAGGGYKEFPGLEILVGTTKVDALTGTACPSLASDVKNFNYGLIDPSNDPTGPNGIIHTLNAMTYFLTSLAETTRMDPVRWAFVMRPMVFRALTEIWPCAYYTYRCLASAGNAASIDAQAAIDLRDRMRNGRFLLIDGREWPVILDDGIPEDNNANNTNVPSGFAASDIYLLPLTVAGSVASTYMEYLDYQQGAMHAATAAHSSDEFWSDGGRFLWTKKTKVMWCVQLAAKVEPRIILKTPHLAGRLQNVRYSAFQHTRDAYPSDPYWVNGGVSTARTMPEIFSDWNPS